jgi:hypothetical protein
VSDHNRPEPPCKSTVTELPRIVGLVHHPRSKPPPTIAERPRIESCTEPPAAEPELSFRARVEPHGGGAELVARARTRIGVIAVSCVLIVFFIVAGVVLVARSGVAQREDSRRSGRCTEHIERIERTCTRDGP